MKQYNRRELLLYIIASSAEAVLFYIGYMFISQIIGSSVINILFFIILALCGLLINILPYNNADKRKQSFIYSIIGLILASIVTAISAVIDFNLFSALILFAVLILLYYRANLSYIFNVLYVYSIWDFKKNISILFLLNLIAAYVSDVFAVVSGELIRYTVFYILMSLYMLAEIKHFRYESKNGSNKKSTFDILAITGMIALTVMMSVPKVFAVFIKPFVLVFGFVYDLIVKLLIYISYPIAKEFNYLYNLIKIPENSNLQENMSKANDALNKRYNKTIADEISPNAANLIEIIGKTLAFLILLAICAYVLYLLFRFIDRYNSSKTSESFEEEKEFVIGKRNLNNMRLINKFGDTVKKAAGEVVFMLTADNADKLRNEYKDFIKKLYSKKIIEHYNYTAMDIYDIAMQRVPDKKEALEDITSMYEEVRYGVKYPQNNELNAFRKSLAVVSKAIIQSQ